jgi:uncharacterized protein YaiL (DUF2058 family)
MTKLTLQEQMLKAGLVSSKKAAKVQRTAKKSRVQAREAREAVEEKKKRRSSVTSSSANSRSRPCWQKSLKRR